MRDAHAAKLLVQLCRALSSQPSPPPFRYSRSKPRTPGEEVGQSLVLCRPDSTLLEVVALLVGSKIHRVYVIDDKEQPVGIVTMTDVLRKVVELTH